MALRRRVRTGTGIAAALVLAACSAAPDDSVADLEATLSNDTADPVILEALAAPLAVDPDLTSQANINAVRSGERLMGNAIPRLLPAAGSASLPPLSGGPRMTAPEPTAAASCPDCEADGPVTLGALAREQARRVPSTCAAAPDYRLEYGMQWAERLPPPFALYPGAALMDAAGADAPACTLRAVSFVTAAPSRESVDYYYTQLRRAGFNTSHQRMDDRAILIGVRNRDKAAVLMILVSAPDGGTRIDLVVTQPR